MAGFQSPSCGSPLPTIAEENNSAPSSLRIDKPVHPPQHHHHNLRSRIIRLCSRAVSDRDEDRQEDEEDEYMESSIDKLSPGCRPLFGILSNLLPCRRGGRSHHHASSNSISQAPAPAPVPEAAAAAAAAATKPVVFDEHLVELNRRQQSALVDKQDTIDMLEWQLEQLHSMAMKEREITGICCRHKKRNSVNFQQGRSSPGGHEDQEDCCTLSRDCVVGVLKSKDSPPPIKSKDSPPAPKNSQSITDVQATATELLLEMTIVRATLSIRRFCKVFMKQMEISGYSVRALADLEPRTNFVKKEHTAFALESRVNKALFHCFENESFDQHGITRILDASQRALSRLEEFQRMKLLDIADAVNPEHAAFEPEFLRFCENKTQDMWGLFPWSVVFKTPGERNAFTSAFINACKGVWLLHRLAYSMNPAASIIRIGRGVEVNPVYVEPVVAETSLCDVCKDSKVEFMVMPGFRTLKKTVKCLVYVHAQCK